MELLDGILGIVSLLASIPLMVLTIEMLIAMLPFRRCPRKSRPPVAILMPAHNEEAGLAKTLEQLLPELAPGDRLILIADNCTDSTAELARRYPVEVVERHHATQRGKGYALARGLEHLASNPPPWVMVVDADCQFEPGHLGKLAEAAAGTGRVCQAVYTFYSSESASVKQQVSDFAVAIKNEVRPRGLDRVGLPTLLFGTGMIFPWSALQKVQLASGEIVEDMKLGIDLTLAGLAPRYVPDARCVSSAPAADGQTKQQRTRWEHGHVMAIVRHTPKLVAAGLLRGNLSALALAAELSVPPVSLLLIAVLSWWAVCLILWQWLNVGSLAFGVISASIFLVGMMIPLVWYKFARKLIAFRTLVCIPFYMAWKVPLYARLIFARQQVWNRTARLDARGDPT